MINVGQFTSHFNKLFNILKDFTNIGTFEVAG